MALAWVAVSGLTSALAWNGDVAQGCLCIVGSQWLESGTSVRRRNLTVAGSQCGRREAQYTDR
jgi:hypothetical protein